MKPEITESYIVDAVKHYKIKRKKNIIISMFNIIPDIGLFLLGIFFRHENFFNDNTMTLWFYLWVVALIIVIISVVIRELNGGN